jgi:exosortase H (IPTLxxWG-CTERM-specific)
MAQKASGKSEASLLKRYPVASFLGIFGLIMLAFYAFWLTDFFKEHILYPWIVFNTHVSGFILNILGQQVQVNGDVISSIHFAVAVKQGCDAIEPTMLFVAGVIAFPAFIRNKMLGLLAGTVFLFGMNIIRIVSLYLIGRYATPELFEFMHIEVWQIIFIFLAMIAWFLWLRWAIKDLKREQEIQNPQTAA